MRWVRREPSRAWPRTSRPSSSTASSRRLLASVVKPEQLRRILKIMLDENEFLSPYGIRSVSKIHERPYTVRVAGVEYTLDYEPGESTAGVFGGNSNWRGPIWMPLNYLLIEALQRFDHYLGEDFKVECPTGSGKMMTLWEVAVEISHRLTRLFLRDDDGRRPVNGGQRALRAGPALARPGRLQRVLPRRGRPRARRQSPDGLDGAVAKLLQQSGASLPMEAMPRRPQRRPRRHRPLIGRSDALTRRPGNRLGP